MAKFRQHLTLGNLGKFSGKYCGRIFGQAFQIPWKKVASFAPLLVEGRNTEEIKGLHLGKLGWCNIVSGSGGPEPDLLLVYGPARCHLGFPACRIKYTEIVHMGPLKPMNYGSLIKAIYKFTMKINPFIVRRRLSQAMAMKVRSRISRVI
ncbi:hypothetical protein J1N35_031922 [Gossypium stocksii]|uniref:ditrans,polycis-polyprenyl diphosphate synthase [(2E,6E)-farnesyldiphosphate specific] n=1 Tax=Gossypium stocksii TaxID=47602 RepID=A0A9D3V2V4_9ROSI|nr:hypothetical protein J1N35_031922 [Gossypium stocksii]